MRSQLEHSKTEGEELTQYPIMLRNLDNAGSLNSHDDLESENHLHCFREVETIQYLDG